MFIKSYDTVKCSPVVQYPITLSGEQCFSLERKNGLKAFYLTEKVAL